VKQTHNKICPSAGKVHTQVIYNTKSDRRSSISVLSGQKNQLVHVPDLQNNFKYYNSPFYIF